MLSKYKLNKYIYRLQLLTNFCTFLFNQSSHTNRLVIANNKLSNYKIKLGTLTYFSKLNTYNNSHIMIFYRLLYILIAIYSYNANAPGSQPKVTGEVQKLYNSIILK